MLVRQEHVARPLVLGVTNSSTTSLLYSAGVLIIDILYDVGVEREEKFQISKQQLDHCDMCFQFQRNEG